MFLFVDLARNAELCVLLFHGLTQIRMNWLLCNGYPVLFLSAGKFTAIWSVGCPIFGGAEQNVLMT